MRVTLDVKEATRSRILQRAQKLFQKKGFVETTTRDIAREAGIATGTLFNYFSNKESLAVSLVADALGKEQEEFTVTDIEHATLEESLFANIAVSLRALKPHRRYLQPILETMFSPLAGSNVSPEAEHLRLSHLETVSEIITAHSSDDALQPSSLSLHLYWTLYLGILSFWSTDASPNQEESLVLVDQSTRLFVESLQPHSVKGV